MAGEGRGAQGRQDGRGEESGRPSRHFLGCAGKSGKDLGEKSGRSLRREATFEKQHVLATIQNK